jgi:flavin-dependent dehydrogenase
LGYEVLILDRKPFIGSPMQCAGLVNVEMFSLEGLTDLYDKVVLKEIKGARIYSPSGNILPLRGEKKKAVSIDRSYFDHEMLLKAAKKRIDILLGSEVVNATKTGKGIHNVSLRASGNQYDIEGDLIIGCDGPGSMIRRCVGIGRPKEVAPGVNIEAEIKDVNIPSDEVAVLTGNEVAKGFFAWAIPSRGLNGIRLGLSAMTGNDVTKGLRILLKDFRLANFLSVDSISEDNVSMIGRVYGGIPMGQPSTLHEDGFLLLGDSAGMAKPTSGGGIFPGLRAVDLLADLIGSGGMERRSLLEKFNQEWNRGYGRELNKGMILRRIVRELSDNDIEKAVNALNDDRKLNLINSTGDIDRPISLAVKLLRMDPSLLMLVPRYLPHLRGLLK